MKAEIGLKIGDYEVIELIPNYKVKLKCQVCDYIRIVQWGDCQKRPNKHGNLCEENYWYSLIGEIKGDFKIINIVKKNNSFKIIMKCLKCGKEKEVSLSNFWANQHLHGDSCGEYYYNNLIGTIYGDLEIIKYVKRNKASTLVEVKCKECGLIRIKDLGSLRLLQGVYHSSCAYIKISEMRALHNDREAFDLFHTRYQGMKSRTSYSHPDRQNYIDREINSDSYPDFESFYNEQWGNFLVAYEKYNNNISLERIDNDKSYYKDNIMWTDFKYQLSNTRKNKWFQATDPHNNNYYSKNISELACQHNLSGCAIGRCLRHQQIQHRGWIFKYVEKEEALELERKRVEKLKEEL